MANSKELFGQLANKITLRESKEEIHSIIFLLMENQFGLSRTDVLAGKYVDVLDPPKWEEFVFRINQQEPIQYILGTAEFYGRKFIVDHTVLIPRPETELIVRELLTPQFAINTSGPILDIGTGSGCLAVTLARELPTRIIYATDISQEALQIAAENAKLNKANVNFILHDILQQEIPVTEIGIIISNPPYITFAERNSMSKNVVEFEPALALFVSDNDPLIFYKAIARRGRSVLAKDGKVIVEINEKFGKEVAALFEAEGYRDVLIHKDLDGKDRLVSSTVLNR